MQQTDLQSGLVCSIKVDDDEEEDSPTSSTPTNNRKTFTTRFHNKHLPPDLHSEDQLLLFKDQILQVSKQRPHDDWAYGIVVYDTFTNRPPSGVDGLSVQAGWFLLSKTKIPDSEQLQQLQELMGGAGGSISRVGAAEALIPPNSWDTHNKDPMVPVVVPVKDEAEWKKVVDYFESTLLDNHIGASIVNSLGGTGGKGVRIHSVERVQNTAMWQSYAVKRTTILKRELSQGGENGRLEREWLFHGTDEDTVMKIVQQGFNRSFCGKNATRWGKGVYFATNSSYSVNVKYSRPNKQNIQHIFLCRVMVGAYCQGQRNALTPKARDGHSLYDSTVDRMTDPTIFVTFHDAQSYPEYLVKFSQNEGFV